MANEQHLAILKQGVEVWNEWRSENLRLKVDLSGAKLLEFDLTNADLSNASLSSANLSRTDLFKSNLSGANLNGANFNGANLRRADLGEADLMGADLREANLSSANLSSANLSRTDLNNAKLSNAKLSNANLSNANLIWADLSGANLSNANLSNANLSNVDLMWAYLGLAILYESNVIATNFYNATLTGACIKGWNINSETTLDKVVCEYVYVSGEYDDEEVKINPQERRPIEGKFLPGEFASLYKKIIESTDLILRKTPESANNANNQGVKFNFNNKTHTWQRLTFRSKTEIKIAEALDRAEVLFLPNCLARLNTPNGRANKEADFLICYNGKWGILEVDGPYHTPERRVEEQERERIFRRHGIKVVERFDSSRCYENPDEVVQEFFKMLEIGYS